MSEYTPAKMILMVAKGEPGKYTKRRLAREVAKRSKYPRRRVRREIDSMLGNRLTRNKRRRIKLKPR